MFPAIIRLVPPLPIVYTFCASWNGPKNSNFSRTLCLLIRRYFCKCGLLTCGLEKEDHSKGLYNPKSKLGVTTTFSD